MAAAALSSTTARGAPCSSPERIRRVMPLETEQEEPEKVQEPVPDETQPDEEESDGPAEEEE